ncbi:MAG: 23S rRNA (guanosine(2251)-2'-O)-methyltransferase RlmB [Schleiferiaceae bacterium]|nr:23S rRNA (guanosine(2251)-2'-O)-methyltransferase RlmB [Schleiferiaceae bacterium]
MKETSKSEWQTHPIHGIRPIIEAIEAGKEIDKIFIQKGLSGDLIGQLRDLTRKKDIPLKQVPIDKLNRITRKNHQGVIAYIAPVSFQPLQDAISRLEEKEAPLILMLDRVTDVRNFGAITRTAECVGADAIVIGKQGAAPVNADAVKTSTGALLRVPICREQNLKTTLQTLKENGYQAIACTEKTSASIYEPDYTKPTVVIMGSEEDGISDTLLKRADHLAAIPMHGKIGSLNVSVAAGIILYEALRQRTA